MKFAFIGFSFLQGLVIFIDEIYFHRKRFLPRWERLGHPVDTLFLLMCFLFLILAPHTAENEKIYFALSLTSCLMITKDEWIHQKLAPSAELWLHSVLFILHPLVLICAYLISDTHIELIKAFATATGFFMIYQIFYWNIYAKN